MSDERERLLRGLRQYQEIMLSAAEDLMSVESGLGRLESEEATVARMIYRERLAIEALGTSSILKALSGDVDKASTMLKKSREMHEVLVQFAESKGHDIKP